MPAVSTSAHTSTKSRTARRSDNTKLFTRIISASVGIQSPSHSTASSGSLRRNWRMPRPTHAGRQRRYYSGRKKRHTVKNVIVTAQGQVRWGSRTVPGRRHDKTVTKQERLRLPKAVMVLADSGFAGLDPGAATLITPWKKPKGRRLHWQRRAFNRLLARARVKVEHTLASVKRLRILRDEFRNRHQGMVDAVMEIGCTLHNYHWTCRQAAAA